jgi:hypothetical protein
MTNPAFSTAIQAFHDAIAALQVASGRGTMLPADWHALIRLYGQIQDVPGVGSPPGESGTAQEMLNWLVPALGAFRAEQARRHAIVAPAPATGSATAATSPWS